MTRAGGSNPLVSVVIPAFNVGHYVAEAVGSVLHQTYSDIECIVVDDGSTDHTDAALAAFSGSVRVIRTAHRGVSHARNTGIDAARGAFVAFLDADDLWLPRKLERQMDGLRSAPGVAMAYSGFHVVDSDLCFVGRVEPPEPERALANTLLLEGPAVNMDLTAVIEKQLLDQVGRFDEDLSISQDCDLACRLLQAAPAIAIPAPLALYRLHPGQIHRNPGRIETEMRMIFDRFFSSPEVSRDLRRLRRRAHANLAVSLAWAHHMQGDELRFLRYAVRGLALRPDRVLDAIWRMTQPSDGINRSA